MQLSLCSRIGAIRCRWMRFLAFICIFGGIVRGRIFSLILLSVFVLCIRIWPEEIQAIRIQTVLFLSLSLKILLMEHTLDYSNHYFPKLLIHNPQYPNS